MTQKIFGIGFHKTGTTSLAEALRILGYRVTGPNGVNNPEIGTTAWEMAKDLVPRYDAFQDNPWPVLFRQLDQRYLGSKFILTLRPTNKWIASAVRHFGSESTPMREWIYGVGFPEGNESIYTSRYEKHNSEVLAYFCDRPSDLLLLRITEGEGWDMLCAFLRKPLPGVPFPRANRAEDREVALAPQGVFQRLRSRLGNLAAANKPGQEFARAGCKSRKFLKEP